MTDLPNHQYGSFLGSPDPVVGDTVTGDDPLALLGYALERAADELLTTEQICGVLNYAMDALQQARRAKEQYTPTPRESYELNKRMLLTTAQVQDRENTEANYLSGPHHDGSPDIVPDRPIGGDHEVSEQYTSEPERFPR